MLPFPLNLKTPHSVHSTVVSVWKTVIYIIVRISRVVSFLCKANPRKIGTMKKIVRGIDLSKKYDRSKAGPTEKKATRNKAVMFLYIRKISNSFMRPWLTH
jgi:hypothetical protein